MRGLQWCGGCSKSKICTVHYNLVPNVCLKFSMVVVNFTTSIFENVYVKLCRTEMFDVVACDFVLLMKVFVVVGWSDAGGLRYLRKGTLLSVAVLILEVQLERRLSKLG